MTATAERPTLTMPQQRVYDFIRRRILERGHPPTIREICAEMGFSSPNGVICHLRPLEKKGYIHWRSGRDFAQPRTMTLASAEIVVEQVKGTVRVSVAGRPEFTRAEWVEWLKAELARAGY